MKHNVIYEGDIFVPGERIVSRAIIRAPARRPFWNVSTRKVGGLRFIKLGRLTIALSISRQYKPM